MGLFSAILGLPLAPLRGVIWLGEVIQQRVEQQMTDPTVIRRELEAIDEKARAGELSPEEQRAAQSQVLGRLIPQPATPAPPADEH
ncbi:gas vesicle protein GvpG [Rhodococcus sp. NPDC003318]|uniref:gas vesicle protein GvpG n=1 Tax=Rhodococcus sp. NPDC003318 TaxID=3364503 RepID=UPI00367E7196